MMASPSNVQAAPGMLTVHNTSDTSAATVCCSTEEIEENRVISIRDGRKIIKLAKILRYETSPTVLHVVS